MVLVLCHIVRFMHREVGGEGIWEGKGEEGSGCSQSRFFVWVTHMGRADAASNVVGFTGFFLKSIHNGW